MPTAPDDRPGEKPYWLSRSLLWGAEYRCNLVVFKFSRRHSHDKWVSQKLGCSCMRELVRAAVLTANECDWVFCHDRTKQDSCTSGHTVLAEGGT